MSFVPNPVKIKCPKCGELIENLEMQRPCRMMEYFSYWVHNKSEDDEPDLCDNEEYQDSEYIDSYDNEGERYICPECYEELATDAEEAFELFRESAENSNIAKKPDIVDFDL